MRTTEYEAQRIEHIASVLRQIHDLPREEQFENLLHYYSQLMVRHDDNYEVNRLDVREVYEASKLQYSIWTQKGWMLVPSEENDMCSDYSYRLYDHGQASQAFISYNNWETMPEYPQWAPIEVYHNMSKEEYAVYIQNIL